VSSEAGLGVIALNTVRRIPRNLRTWRAVFSTFLQESMVYRANMVIWILTDVVTAVTMPLIWLASYNGRASIHGFSPSQMVVYYLVILGLTSLIEAHVMWDMASEVKQGKFNQYVLRPMSFASYMFAANLGWRLVRTVLAVPLFALVTLAFHHYLPSTMQVNAGPKFWLAVVLGHLVSFWTTYALGLLSLWLYEVRAIYNLYYLPVIIFSGQVAPLALFPAALQQVARFLPFGYTLAFPANIFLKRISPEALMFGYGMQLFWIAVASAAAVMLWRGGVKRFTAFGV
jgi:ABC-2 type transport system permease protein